jgi:hypothetical protein
MTALNIFKELRRIKVVGYRRRAEVYALTGREPEKDHLDRYIVAPDRPVSGGANVASV